jgi:hypothetical protein
MGWLDAQAQPPASVLYMSFGTTSSFRGEQVAEMAAALRGSRQRFIWVLRDADRADIFADESSESLQDNKLMMSQFRKETEGAGLVITGWAPQPTSPRVSERPRRPARPAGLCTLTKLSFSFARRRSDKIRREDCGWISQISRTKLQK